MGLLEVTRDRGCVAIPWQLQRLARHQLQIIDLPGYICVKPCSYEYIRRLSSRYLILPGFLTRRSRFHRVTPLLLTRLVLLDNLLLDNLTIHFRQRPLWVVYDARTYI